MVTRRHFLRWSAGLGGVALLPSWARAASASEGPMLSWLAGDFHCHTVLSGDVGRGPTAAPPTDPPEFGEHTLLWGWTAGEQIGIAEDRGLDFLAVTDHNTVATLSAPDYRSDRLVLVPGYEHSLSGGHAGVFVADSALLPDVIRDADGSRGFSGDAGVERFLDAVRELDGTAVLNHPFYGNPDDQDAVAWEYSPAASGGFDGVEVWNGSWLSRHDVFPIADFDNHLALPWWERELLARGRMTAMGGSDNHFRITTPVAGVGQPTTWVLAADRSAAAVLEAVKAGRTSVSSQPPALGGARLDLVVEAPGGRTALIGDAVPPGAPLTATVAITARPVLPGERVRLISTGAVVADVPAAAAQSFTVTLPAGGWLRAELYTDRTAAMSAVTSPLYAAGPAGPAVPTTGESARYVRPARSLLPLSTHAA